MAFNGFEDADDNGGGGVGGGSGGTYRGAISLAPNITLSPATITNLVGGSITDTVDTVDTVTVGTLELTAVGGVSVYTVKAESSPIDFDISDVDDKYIKVFWPPIPPNETGCYMVCFTTENMPAEVIFQCVLGGSEFFDAVGIAFFQLWASGVTVVSGASSVAGTGSAIQNPLTLPTGDTKIAFSPSTGDIQFIWDDGAQNAYAGRLPVESIATGENLKIIVAYFTLSSVTELAELKVGFGYGTSGIPEGGSSQFKNVTSTPIVLPTNANDGDYLKASVGGIFGTKTVPTGAYFVLIQNKTDCIVLPESAGLTEAQVNALILASIQTGQPLQQVVQAYIDTALINYNDKTGLNIVGTWDATSVETLLLSNFIPADGIAGAVSNDSLLLITPLPDIGAAFGGRSKYFSLEDTSNLSAYLVDTWQFDFLMPDMTGLDAAIYIEVCPQADPFYTATITNHARITYQDGAWSGAGGSYAGIGLNAGDRIRIKLSSTANTITAYKVSDPQNDNSQEIFLFYDVFIDAFPVGILKANISMAFFTDTPAISTFRMFGSRRLVPPPEGMADKNTFRVTVADEFSYWGDTLLQVDDFATFYQNTQQVAVMRLYTAAQINAIANNLPLGVYREVGTSAAMNNGSIFIALSDTAGHSYVIYTELGLVVGASTLDSFELKLTTDGDIENTTSLKDGLKTVVKIDTNAGGGITEFITTGFYGEPINTIEIAANCITLLSYHVTFMFDGTWKWTLDSKSVL